MDKLLKLRGDSPCPADFSRYWENVLKEFNSTNLQYTLISGPIQPPFAECFDLWFTGVGGQSFTPIMSGHEPVQNRARPF